VNNIVLEKWFPTIIGYKFYDNHSKIENELVERCKSIQQNTNSGGVGWISKETYNTSDGAHDLFLDKNFLQINNWVDQQIHEFCEKLHICGPIIRNSSWFNIYKQHDYQEIHTHPGSIISAIYCLSGSEEGAKIFFKSPKNDMFNVKYTEPTEDNHNTVIYKFQAGKLLLFLSDNAHSVEKHSLQSERISLSYNYTQALK
jgi:uncharacterized protein (TIGR02466 family)